MDWIKGLLDICIVHNKVHDFCVEEGVVFPIFGCKHHKEKKGDRNGLSSRKSK